MLLGLVLFNLVLSRALIIGHNIGSSSILNLEVLYDSL